MMSVSFHDREIYKLLDRTKQMYHLYFKALRAHKLDEKEILRLEKELEKLRDERVKHSLAISDILNASGKQS